MLSPDMTNGALVSCLAQIYVSGIYRFQINSSKLQLDRMEEPKDDILDMTHDENVQQCFLPHNYVNVDVIAGSVHRRATVESPPRLRHGCYSVLLDRNSKHHV